MADYLVTYKFIGLTREELDKLIDEIFEEMGVIPFRVEKVEEKGFLFLFWTWAVLVTVPLSLSFKYNCKCINFKIMNYLKLDVWQRKLQQRKRIRWRKNLLVLPRRWKS